MATKEQKAQSSWQGYEEAVFQECERVYHFRNCEILKNAHLVGRYSGAKRQIDVLVRFIEGESVISTMLVECKHYAQKINVKIVDSFIGCLEDVGADKGVIVSEKGFTKAAINRAYKGKEDIEVDILSLGELQQFQFEGAFPYCGKHGLAIAAPFGWVIDGKRRGFAPAIFYRRGLPFEVVAEKEKEWMYLQFWEKEPDVDTVNSLIEVQNGTLRDYYESADIHVHEQDGLMVREARLSSCPTMEITVFREFDRFIAFLVLFCPDCYISKDTKKAIGILKEAIPINIRMKSKDTSAENCERKQEL